MTKQPLSTPQNIQAAGRVLAARNAEKLRSAFETIAQILLDAKILDSKALEALIEKDEDETEEEEKAEIQASEALEVVEEEIQASKFKEMLDHVSWDSRLRMAFDIFGGEFQSCLRRPSEDFETGSDREDVIDELISDLTGVLAELQKSFQKDQSYCHAFSLSAQDENEPEPVQIGFATTFACAAGEDLDANSVNRTPVEGVLFRIDEPSDAIPAVGPGMRLLIPRHVAEKVLPHVSGLPLDAHDTLTKHAQEEVTGVMMSASIEGQDFRMKGLLWPWNRPEKVAAIKAAGDRLGTSINAAAIGHPEKLPNSEEQVFHVDKLILLGANILYSEKATFKRTNLISAEEAASSTPDHLLIAAEALSPEDEVLEIYRVADELAEQTSLPASADDELDVEDDSQDSNDTDIPTQLEETVEESEVQDLLNDPKTDDIHPEPGESSDMADPQVLAQLESISQGLANLSTLSTLVERQQQTIENLQLSMNELQTERKSTLEEIQAAAAQKTAQESEASMIARITDAVTSAMNPTGQPRRRTNALAIAAGASTTATLDQGQVQLQLQLASLTGRLTELRRNPHPDGTEELKVVEEIRQLQSSMGSIPSV